MPIAERGVLSLKTVNDANEPVDLLVLKWPAGSDRLFVAIPLRVCQQGIILALPVAAIPAEVLDEAAEGPGEGLVGPSWVVTVSAQGGEDNVEPVEVMLVEFRLAIRLQLERRNPRSRRAITTFAEDPNILPDFRELNDAVASWVESGEARLEDYYTAVEEELPEQEAPQGDAMAAILTQLEEIKGAMDHRFSLLEGRVNRMQPTAAPSQAAPKPVPNRPQPNGGGARGDRMEEVLNAVRGQASQAPAGTPDEPAHGGQTAVSRELLARLEGVPKGEPSTDDLVKLALVKVLQGKQGKRSRKLPGLPSVEESDSSGAEDRDVEWSSSSRGGRGIQAVEKLNAAMRTHPEPYQERMESRMMKAVEAAEMTPMVPLQYVKTCPVGKSRTAGYCLQGYAHILRLLLENKPRQARLHVLRMISALEQFLIDENWAVASRLTGTEEPPWGHWATQDLGALRRQYVYTRLSEATWVGALINELKEEEWLVKKRNSTPNKPPKGAGKAADPEAGS